MPTRITEEANSRYNEYSSYVRAGQRPVRIAYVEGDEDVAFWTRILQLLDPETFYDVQTHKLPDKGRPPAGATQRHYSKAGILKFADSYGPYMIGCVDADFDYLLETHNAHLMEENDFILHTAYHSMESVKGQGPLLNRMYRQLTGESPDEDMEAYLEEISGHLKEAFLKFLCVLDSEERPKSLYNDFRIYLTGITHPPKGCAPDYLWHYPPAESAECKAAEPLLRARLDRCCEDSGYLYKFIRGHDLYRIIVKSLLLDNFTHLAGEHHKQLHEQSPDDPQKAERQYHAFLRGLHFAGNGDSLGDQVDHCFATFTDFSLADLPEPLKVKFRRMKAHCCDEILTAEDLSGKKRASATAGSIPSGR